MTDWDLVPGAVAPPAILLKDLDTALSIRYLGTRYEFRPVPGRDAAPGIEARQVTIADHVHAWSLPIDELRGRRACKFPGCGHVATRAEMFAVQVEEWHRREGRSR